MIADIIKKMIEIQTLQTQEDEYLWRKICFKKSSLMVLLSSLCLIYYEK